MPRCPNSNRLAGAFFEKMFAYRARAQGYLCVRNGQEIRFLAGGKMLPIKSNLDWTLVDASGHAFFADTKTFAGNKFTYSQLSSSQLARVQQFHQHNAQAGFVVYLRAADAVVWFDAAAIAAKGPGSGFGPTDGVWLGQLASFSLARLRAAPPATSSHQA